MDISLLYTKTFFSSCVWEERLFLMQNGFLYACTAIHPVKSFNLILSLKSRLLVCGTWYDVSYELWVRLFDISIYNFLKQVKLILERDLELIGCYNEIIKLRGIFSFNTEGLIMRINGIVQYEWQVFCSMPILGCVCLSMFAMAKARLLPVCLQTVQTLPWIWICQTQQPAVFASPGFLEVTTGAPSHVSIHTHMHSHSHSHSSLVLSHLSWPSWRDWIAFYNHVSQRFVLQPYVCGSSTTFIHLLVS